MLYHALAAFFLVPSSFVIFGRGWLRALGFGPWYFFGQIVKIGPQLVLKRGLLFNLFVFYPMRAGIEIVRRRSLGFVFRAAAGLLRQRIRGDRPPVLPGVRERLAPLSPLPPLRGAALARMVERPDVRIVSVDIFDTLLTRPVINDPRELFHLVAARVNTRFDVDFAALRWSAESEMGDRYATLGDIYAHIRRRHGLDEETARALMAEELRCERILLRPRPDMLDLCRAAARAGKRVVAVSDMYLPSDFLLEVLHEKGFADVAAVYVSAELKARKTDDGALFEAMLKAENVSPEAVLHLGDDRRGDVVEPLRRGIAAVHVPSVRQMLQERGGMMARELMSVARRTPLWGLLLGHALERIFDRPENAPASLERCTMSLLARLALGPLVTSLCLRARAVAEREGYARVYYASRDGWLPSLVHAAVRERLGGAEGVYFQAGRRAYFPFLASSFVEYARTRKLASDLERFTLEDLLRGHFGDEAAPVLAEMTEEERLLPFCKERRKAVKILERLTARLEELMEARRNRARLYYGRVFAAEEERLLVFDVGYSGSVSTALSAAAGKPVDKLYCWQNDANREADRRLGTRTFLLVGGEGYLPYHLVLEELFAPCEGGVIDFDAQGKPIFESFRASEAMRSTLAEAHEECVAYARDVTERFGDYAPLLAADAPSDVLHLLRRWFHATPLGNGAVLRPVVFPDPVYCERAQSLEEKIDGHLSWQDVFTGTGFDDNGNIMPLYSLPFPEDSLCAGVHMHIYNAALAQEFARYAAAIPIPFDLYVTHVRSEDAALLRALFDASVLPQARRVVVRQTPNRGRDVAPWLAGVGREQLAYDIFCHVHAKESAHMHFGDAWRAYLLDNLLRPEAVRAVVAAFRGDSRLGCVFPAIYEPLRQVMTRVGVPLYGSEEEFAMITGLLARMGLSATYGRDEQFFSGGTMMWFRPQAVRPLLECGLRFEDFPEEPIGVGGTPAHALERVPPLVCKRCGYDVRSLTCYPSVLY
ncbi:MAG: hypothetical protein MSH25_03370 [Desulfovibrio sp.]|uniref:rhamnan synthesis F family protein n=1 Tax=Desulfovibrio sp. TaxID=885 RepID=UPI0025C18677|nr:rhamnan synthesis F family protein [Desulfovibrio sp.]MCI7568401.1 hypothetical protein [Desulfovibrio sp.]